MHEGIPRYPDILLPLLHDDTLPPSWRHNGRHSRQNPIPALRRHG